MKVLIKNEIKKGLKNPLFVVALIIGLILALMSAVPAINYYQNSHFKIMIQEAMRSNYVKYNIIQSDSLYKYWLGADAVSIASNLFYTLFPLLACLPYGWSLSEDLQSGYIKNISPKVGRKNYFIAKSLVTFLVGGITILVPMILNFMIVSMYIPAIQMNVLYNEFFQIQHGNTFSNLAYNLPLLHALLYIFISFIFAGTCALLSAAMAFFTKNKVLTITLPFLIFLFSHSFETFSVSFNLPILSLSRILKPLPIYGVMKIEIMILWFIIILVFSVGSIWRGGKRIEIF